ncbi:MAG: hypothetical protein R3A10_17970 [Caldilineaceae bacterium]
MRVVALATSSTPYGVNPLAPARGRRRPHRRHQHRASASPWVTLRDCPHRPLLCFDDVDFLRPPHAEQPNPQHTRVLGQPARTRTGAPHGPARLWESDAVYPVAEFTMPNWPPGSRRWPFPITPPTWTLSTAHTGGNLRLWPNLRRPLPGRRGQQPGRGHGATAPSHAAPHLAPLGPASLSP